MTCITKSEMYPSLAVCCYSKCRLFIDTGVDHVNKDYNLICSIKQMPYVTLIKLIFMTRRWQHVSILNFKDSGDHVLTFKLKYSRADFSV